MTRNRLRNSALFSGSALGLACLISPIANANPIYNAADDFSPSSNTSTDIWTYGLDSGTIAGAPDQSTFTRFTTPELGSALGPQYSDLDVWRNTSSIDPNVIHNRSSTATDTDGSNTWLPNELTLGPATGPTVVRFTAPTTGVYDLTAIFSPAQNATNSAPEAYVFVNGVQIFSALASSPVGPAANTPLALTAGDTVDFVVAGSNVNLSYGNKTTGLDATLTIPEPTSLGLLGLGAVSLMARRRRQA